MSQNNEAILRTEALWDAISRRDMESVRFLVMAGADINATGEYGWTPLVEAVNAGEQEMVSFLIDHGADVNVKSSSGDTPLIYAASASYDQEEIAEILIKAGADVNAKGWLGETALCHACSERLERTAMLILKSGADEGLDDALYKAVLSRMDEMVKELVSRGANPNLKVDGDTLLSMASEKGYTDMMRLLISLGANIDEPDEDTRTPLLVAIEASSPIGSSIPMLLIERGASPELSASDGTTPLYLASFKGMEDVVEELLKRGADINKLGMNGMLPLAGAVEGGYILVAEILLKYGAKADEKDQSGKTPVERAFDRGDYKMLQFLLESCCPMDKKELLKWKKKAEKSKQKEVAAVLGLFLEPTPAEEKPDIKLILTGPRELTEEISEKWKDLLEKTSNSGDAPSLIFLGELLSLLDGGSPCVFKAAAFGESHMFGRTVDYSLETEHLKLIRKYDSCINESWQSMETYADEISFIHPDNTPDLTWSGEAARYTAPMQVNLKGISHTQEKNILQLARSYFRVVNQVN